MLRRLVQDRNFQLRLVVCGVLLACGSLNAEEGVSSDQFYSDGTLVSSLEPALAIKVDDALSYVGRHSFAIRDVAAGERFIFAEADGGVVQRLVIVQFEGFLPEIDDAYRYDLSQSPVVANYPFRSNGYAFDIIESIAANPVSESAATYPFLQSKGYEVPSQWMMWRSLTVVDEARKKEMIVFYVEDVASTDLALDEFYAGDDATKEWAEIQIGLENRASRSIQIAELDDAGLPVTSTWSSIPKQLSQ